VAGSTLRQTQRSVYILATVMTCTVSELRRHDMAIMSEKQGARTFFLDPDRIDCYHAVPRPGARAA
jgi:hypothetical protein